MTTPTPPALKIPTRSGRLVSVDLAPASTTAPPDPATDRPENRPLPLFWLLGAVVLAIAVGWVYSNSTKNAFALDDWHTIQQNPCVRSLSFIPRYFTDASTFSVLPANRDYRPMIDVGYAIDYAWAKAWFNDGYDPRPWHWTNLFIHWVVCVSLFVLGRRLIGRGALAPIPGISWCAGEWIALIAALLFAVHPITTGCGNYITARSSSMVAAFGLPALNLYLHVLSRPIQFWLFAPALVLYACALFTKEEAVSFMAVFALAEMLMGPGVAAVPLWQRPLRRGAWARLGPFVVLTLFYLTVWKLCSPLLGSSTRADQAITPYVYFCTELKAWWYYIGHIVAPVRLVSDEQAFPISWSIKDPAVVLALAGWALVIYISVRLIRIAPAVPFLVGAFFLYMGPHSSVVPLAEMVNEHRPYLPCAGLFILIVAGLYLVLARLGPRPVIHLAAVSAVIGLPLASLTFDRNKVWQSGLTLWGDTAEKSPTSSRAQMNYGLELMKKGYYDQAEERFRNCNRLAPSYAIGYTNLGIVLQHKALLLASSNPELSKTTLAEAAAAHDKAVSLTPFDSTVFYWRATFRVSQQDVAGAIADLQKAAQLNPSDLRTWAALAETLTKAGRAADAQPAIDRGRALDPQGFESERGSFRSYYLK